MGYRDERPQKSASPWIYSGRSWREQGVAVSSEKHNHGLFSKLLPNTGNVADWALVAVGVVVIGGAIIIANKKWAK